VNPFRDDPIIAARKAVRDAEAALAKKPGPHTALRLQRANREWNTMRRLGTVAI
jgi:hypothetical protein